MKVALVHDFLNQLGGAERVLWQLTQIFPRAPIYTLDYRPEIVGKKFPPQKVITPQYPWWIKILPYRWRLFYYPLAIEKFDFSKYDLVISSSSAFAKNIITPPETRHICYCHSPARYLWDWTFEYAREHNFHREMRGWIFKTLTSLLRIWDYYGHQRVDIFIANSSYTARRIKKYWHREAKVIHPPVEVTSPKSFKKGKYFLVVSRLSPYKKVRLAVEACKVLNLPLVVVGTGQELQKLKKIAQSTPNIKIVGFVPDRELKNYYQNALALIFPGEEDFGIVPVEAMSFGKPVIAYQKGGLLETVIEGKTGIFFKEPTVASLCRAIIKLLKNQDQFRPPEIARHAQKFSKEKFIREFKKLIKNAGQK